MRLVEDVVEDVRARLEVAGDARPELRRVLGVGQWQQRALEVGRAIGADDVQLEDRDHALLAELVDVAPDRLAIRRAREGGVQRRDVAEPAVLAERDAHGVDRPRPHGEHRPRRLGEVRGVVARAVEDRVALRAGGARDRAGELAAGAVDAAQLDRLPGCVDEVGTRDLDHRRGARRRRQEDEEAARGADGAGEEMTCGNRAAKVHMRVESRRCTPDTWTAAGGQPRLPYSPSPPASWSYARSAATRSRATSSVAVLFGQQSGQRDEEDRAVRPPQRAGDDPGHEVVVGRAGRLGDHGGDRGGARLPPHGQALLQRSAAANDLGDGEQVLVPAGDEVVDHRVGQRAEDVEDGGAGWALGDVGGEAHDALLAAGEGEVLLRGEVVEDRLLRDVGGRRDLGDGDGVEAALGEEPARGGGDRLAGGALLARAQTLGLLCA